MGLFEVNKTLKILKEKPRHRVRVSPIRLYWLTKNSGILKESKRHINHVNLSIPGIVGQTDESYFLLNGNHRAIWHKINKEPFFVYILTEFETGKIFRKAPPSGKILT